MSIDIHILESGGAGKHLLSINDHEYAELQPAFSQYQAKTRLRISQYGDLKLSSGVQPLIDALEAENSGTDIFSSLLNVLKRSKASGYGIIFVGE